LALGSLVGLILVITKGGSMHYIYTAVMPVNDLLII